MTGRRDSEWGSEGERRAAVFESGAPPSPRVSTVERASECCDDGKGV